MERRTTEDLVQTAYLLGWSANWDRMKRALDKRYKRLQDRKFKKRRSIALSGSNVAEELGKLING